MKNMSSNYTPRTTVVINLAFKNTSPWPARLVLQNFKAHSGIDHLMRKKGRNFEINTKHQTDEFLKTEKFPMIWLVLNPLTLLKFY